MMNPKTILLSAALIGWATLGLRAQEMPQSIRDTLDRHLIGEWIDTTHFDGDTSLALVRRHWSKDHRAYVADLVWSDGRGREVGHWNGKEFAIQGNASSGDAWTLTFTEFESDRWSGKGVGTWQNRPWESPVSITWTEDEFRYEDVTEGKPFIIEGHRAFAQSGADSVQALGQFMVGGVWTRTDEEGTELKHAYDWCCDGKFFKLTTIQDPEPAILFQGVDAVSGRHHLWNFSAKGFAGGACLQKSANEWVFIGQASTPEGLVQGRWDLIATDDETLTVRREVTVGDSPEKQTREVVWKRIPDQPIHETWLDYLQGTWTFQFEDGREGVCQFAAAGEAEALTLKAETDRFAILGVIGWHPESQKFVETDFSREDDAHVHLRREFLPVSRELLTGVQTGWSSNFGAGNQPLEYRRLSDHEMTLTGRASAAGGVDWVVRFKRKATASQ